MKNGEKGQALVIALALVGFGALVVTPFLGHAGSGLIGSRLYGETISEQYSGDAGVEHAIWDLTYDDLADQLTSPGDSVSYQLGEAINGIAANITVSNGWETIASDDFESGGWAGGTGWLNDWYNIGHASVTTSGTPYEGSYHLLLTSADGYVRRSVDLSGLPGAKLQFQAKARSFDNVNEKAYCYISPNGIDWTTVHTWVNGDDDNVYHYFDIDLSSYTLSSEFWIAFEADMSGAQDYLYVDDLKIVWAFDTTAPIASDDFESGGWAGGTGWLYDWYSEGAASVTTAGTPYEGSYHLLLTSADGYVDRAVDLSSLPIARLQFWAKARSFDNASERAYCHISPNDVDWTTVHTWVNGDDDNVYHFFDIDLSPYELSSEFWIAFEADMSGAWDYFYVDDLKIKGATIYGITSVADDETVRAVIKIEGGTITVLYWQVV